MAILYLIGNGFDLAHGLPTRYTDFLTWVMRDAVNKATESKDRIYKDKKSLNVDLSPKENPDKINSFDQALSLFESTMENNKGFDNISFVNSFLASLYNIGREKRWVDIEMEYYQALKNALKDDLIESRSFDKALKLQQEFRDVSELLERYVRVEICPQLKDGNQYKSFTTVFSNLTRDDLVVNFNYTDLPQRYQRALSQPFNVLSIHGSANADSHPIIFGFGDERDEFYQKIENLNNNRLLDHVKSFSYARNGLYRNLDGFLNSGYFAVEIFGLSCGISDRTLLSHIFEHKNCNAIKINYHHNYQNYREVTMEISRHFRDKLLMRKRIIDFENCHPCPQEKA